MGPWQQEVGRKESVGEAARLEDQSPCYGELGYPGRSKLTGLLPSLHSDVQLW